jgi:uncharacterized membrane protein YfcA
MDLNVAAMILLAGLFSGFADAIAGGGGLIMIPALMLGGLPAPAAIATNKLCGTTGCLTSSLTFWRAGLVDWRACVLVGFPAVAGAVASSRVISMLSMERAEPVVIVLLVAVALWLLLKPKFSEAAAAAGAPPRVTPLRMLQSAAVGALVGFHDGFFGPGAGAFMIFALLALWSVSFVRGMGSAKVINLMTNLAAVTSFLWVGAVDLRHGLVAAAGVAVGAMADASFATTRSAAVIKPLFLLVTGLIVVKLGVDYFFR